MGAYKSFLEQYRKCRANGNAIDKTIKGIGDDLGIVWCRKHEQQCMSSTCRDERGVVVGPIDKKESTP